MALAWRTIELSLLTTPGQLKKMLLRHLLNWEMLTVFVNGAFISDAEQARWNKRLFGLGLNHTDEKQDFLMQLSYAIGKNYIHVTDFYLNYDIVKSMGVMCRLANNDILFVERFFSVVTNKPDPKWGVYCRLSCNLLDNPNNYFLLE